ncbi:hypothetical protein U91I_03783 [alpha proteobacterium U9-1i]|nr:hypothetical protein U91I_03783 [alpha proteobacterium U9-1i]
MRRLEVANDVARDTLGAIDAPQKPCRLFVRPAAERLAPVSRLTITAASPRMLTDTISEALWWGPASRK